jgi:hypothetical protein
MRGSMGAGGRGCSVVWGVLTGRSTRYGGARGGGHSFFFFFFFFFAD